MPNPYHFDYRFHPVGQGLFASGTLYGPNHNPKFQWVYDCGTTSPQVLIDREIARLAAWDGNRRRLDLVTLSHFDSDHISGVCRLIAKFAIDTLLLPYLPLWKRLLVAFGEGLGPGDDLMRFFISPADYLTAIEGANIRRIVFVQPGGQASLSAPSGPPRTPGGDDKEDWHFEIDKSTDGDPDELRFLQAHSAATSVQFLPQGASISIRGFWEFVPYNDDPQEYVPEDFRNSVRAQTAALLNLAPDGREMALTNLKRLYDEQFGDSAQKRNVISLFLYGGPIYETWKATGIVPFFAWPFAVWPVPYRPVPVEDIEMSQLESSPEGRSRCSVLYAGDGYLDTPERLARMAGFFGTLRIQRTGAFQVMHHGAKANWHTGVANALAPRFSVFCSDPGHQKFRHPHPPVLRDFWAYHPIKVDKDKGVIFQGLLLPN